MMRKFKEDMRRAKEFYTYTPEQAPRSRTYHWSMVMLDVILALVFATTIIGLPFTLLFSVAAIRRYEKHLKIRK